MILLFQAISITSSHKSKKILLKKIPKLPKSFNSQLKNSNKNSFFLSPTTNDGVEDVLNILKTYKTAGVSIVPTRILKEFKKYLSKPKSELINLSFYSVPFQKL